MTLLRLQNEANCLTVQHTKQSREPQPLSDLETKLSLPRERFSALPVMRSFQGKFHQKANIMLCGRPAALESR